jgi:hypothetical protein
MEHIDIEWIRQAISGAGAAGRGDEMRIDCQLCNGSQKETMAVNRQSGAFICHRCNFVGNIKAGNGNGKQY